MWLTASAAFSEYLANFKSFNVTYGSFAAAIILLVWLWLTNLALLFGAEINAEIERAKEIAEGIAGTRDAQPPARILTLESEAASLVLVQNLLLPARVGQAARARSPQAPRPGLPCALAAIRQSTVDRVASAGGFRSACVSSHAGDAAAVRSAERATAPGRLLTGTDQGIGKHLRPARSPPASPRVRAESATPSRAATPAGDPTTRCVSSLAITTCHPGSRQRPASQVTRYSDRAPPGGAEVSCPRPPWTDAIRPAHLRGETSRSGWLP